MQVLALVYATLAAVSAAATYQFTAPISVSQWKAGSNQKIQWSTAGDAELKDPQSSTLDLMEGDANALILSQNIAENVSASTTDYSFQVPKDIVNGKYSLRLTTVNGSNQKSVSYSDAFTVSGGKTSGAVTNALSVVVLAVPALIML